MRYLLIATLCLCSSAYADELYEQLEKEYLKKQAAAEKRREDYLKAHNLTDEEIEEREKEREKEKEKEKKKAEAARKLQVFRYYGKQPSTLIAKNQTPSFKLDSSKRYRVRFGVQECGVNIAYKKYTYNDPRLRNPYTIGPEHYWHWTYNLVHFNHVPTPAERLRVDLMSGDIRTGDNYAYLHRKNQSGINGHLHLLEFKFLTGPSQLYNEGSAIIDEDVFAKVPERVRDGEYYFRLEPRNGHANVDIRVTEIPEGAGDRVLTQVDKMFDNLKGLLGPIGAGEE